MRPSSPITPDVPPTAVRRRGEQGTALLLALLVLASLAVLATTTVVAAMGDRNLSKFDRQSLMALGAAESGVAFTKRAIVTQTAPLTDYDADGRPDFN